MTDCRRILLDTGVLGLVTHPKEANSRPVVAWLTKTLSNVDQVFVPEIADYELRRELLRSGHQRSVSRLDDFALATAYLPLTTETMREAARLWAEARRGGYPTASDGSLDADVILAAQAKILEEQNSSVVVATDNVGHLRRFVDARRWKDI